MTLKVEIKNDGNQPHDTLVVRGAKFASRKAEDGHPVLIKDRDGRYALNVTEDSNDHATLGKGQAATFIPPTDHFHDFVVVQFKGKH